MFRVPTSVTSPDQALPVVFTLTSRLTSGDVVLDPPQLDFGQCYTAQTTSMTVSLTNASDLPQRFGFVSLPPEIRVQPSQGFGVVLPHETVQRTVLFSPVAATQHAFALTVATTMNRQLKLPVVARGVKCPLTMSSSCIKFGAAVAGEVVDAHVYVTNTSAAPVSFEFVRPRPAAQLVISPLVGRLGPGEQARVQVEFSPTDEPAAAAGDEEKEDDAAAGAEEAEEGENAGDGKADEDGKDAGGDDADASDAEAVPPAAAGVAAAGAGGPVHDIPDHVGSVVVSTAVGHQEPWSRHARWTLPCFVKSEDGSHTHDLPRPASMAHGLALEVHTTTVTSKLAVSAKRLDFGQVSVGQTVVQNVSERVYVCAPLPFSHPHCNPICVCACAMVPLFVSCASATPAAWTSRWCCRG